MPDPTPNPTPASLRECPNTTYTHDHQAAHVVQGTMGWWRVECVVCGCVSGFWETEAEAIAAWNTRPEPPAVRCAKCQFEESATIHQEAYRNVGPAHAFQPAVRCAGNEDAPRKALDTAHKVFAAEVDQLQGIIRDLQSALSAPVPQPPAGNEELRDDLEECLEVIRQAEDGGYEEMDWDQAIQTVKANLRAQLAALQAPTPAPATGTDCPKCEADKALPCRACGGIRWHVAGCPWLKVADPAPACNGTGKATACPECGKHLTDLPCPEDTKHIGHGKREGDR